MKRLSICLALLMLPATICLADSEAPQGQFEIFFLNDTSAGAHRFMQTSLRNLPLADSPWITTADISAYNWETHEIFLKKESANLMDDFQDPLRGLDIPFVVVANGERIYRGQFHTWVSSSIGLGVQIFRIEGETPGIRLGPPGVSSSVDLRSDERIRRCLVEAGLLDR